MNAVASGAFYGERLNGRVNPGTRDWMLTRGGVHIVDARLVLVCDDGALIHMTYGGRIWFDPSVMGRLADTLVRHQIDPRQYYFRTSPTFETDLPAYRRLNGLVAVGVGRLIEGGGVAYDTFKVTRLGRRLPIQTGINSHQGRCPCRR